VNSFSRSVFSVYDPADSDISLRKIGNIPVVPEPDGMFLVMLLWVLGVFWKSACCFKALPFY